MTKFYTIDITYECYVQLEARLSRELTPSSRMPRMMSGIPQIPIIVSQD
jgi:hypothetical protein